MSIDATAKRVLSNLATRLHLEPRAFFSLKVADSRQVLERALGYAVAHELGHYLLASKNHSGTGLMRAALDPSADLAPRSKGATLDPKSRDRLRQRLDMASQCPAVPGVLQKP